MPSHARGQHAVTLCFRGLQQCFSTLVLGKHSTTPNDFVQEYIIEDKKKQAICYVKGPVLEKNYLCVSS